MLRGFFIGLSSSNIMRGMTVHFPPARFLARRFIAGETLDEGVAVVKDLNLWGIKGLMNEVGESVTNEAEATQAAQEFKVILQRIADEGLDSTISLKPSHIGLRFGRDFFYSTVAEIVETAQKFNNIVEIDMEESGDVDLTLETYHRLLDRFGGGIRIAIQAALFRTPNDVKKIIERGGSIRLVKGAYQESPKIAHQSKQDIDRAMIELMELFLAPPALEKGCYLVLGSHDPELIEWLINEAEIRGIEKDKFEIQMLQGIRRDEQKRLASLGYQIRVYVPYGSAWYPYFMRRLAERPSNVFFMARAIVGK